MTAKTQENRAPARRRPVQARARGKIELIFEAAIRLLDKEGLDALTTNRIADVAGISIGTLYQYFAGKDEILDALGQREVDAVLQKLMAVLGAGSPATPERRREVVRILLGAFGGRHRARKALLDRALARRGQRNTDMPAMLVADALSAGTRKTSLTPMAAFVLTQAVIGVIRAALFHDERWLAKPELEDHLVGLIGGFTAYVAARGPAAT